MRKPSKNKTSKTKTVIFFTVLVLVNLLVCNLTFVVGHSMEPTLRQGQALLVFKAYKSIERGNIVITSRKNPLEAHLIKRVIALGGEKVKLEGNALFVDGVQVEEDYLATSREPYFTMEYTVPEGQVFLMGDNREHSRDSREFGAIPAQEIIGKILFLR